MVSTGVFDGLAAIILLVVALLGAYAPVILSDMGNKTGANPSGRSLAYIMGNMLSAGVMVSAGFVHLLGAAIADLNPSPTFPVAPFLCGLGFIMTLLADHTAEALSRQNGWSVSSCHTSSQLPPQNSASSSLHRDDDDRAVSDDILSEEGKAAETGTPNQDKRHNFDIESPPRVNGNGHVHDETAIQPGMTSRRQGDSKSTEFSDRQSLIESGMRSSSEVTLLQPAVSTDSAGGRSLEALAAKISVGLPSAVKPVSFLTAVLMAVALCFHSILEGMAMGAQATVVDTLHIFIAIVAHKGLAAYALGSSVVDSGASKMRFWSVIAVFALATPLGIGLGSVVARFSNSGPAAALSALASGTFLYVAFMEVIPKEMQSAEYGFAKLGMLCLGFGLMSLLAIWA